MIKMTMMMRMTTMMMMSRGVGKGGGHRFMSPLPFLEMNPFALKTMIDILISLQLTHIRTHIRTHTYTHTHTQTHTQTHTDDDLCLKLGQIPANSVLLYVMNSM